MFKGQPLVVAYLAPVEYGIFTLTCIVSVPSVNTAEDHRRQYLGDLRGCAVHISFVSNTAGLGLGSW